MELKNHSEVVLNEELLYNLLGSLYVKFRTINDIDFFIDRFMGKFDEPTKNLIRVLLENYSDTLSFSRCDLISFYSNDLLNTLDLFRVHNDDSSDLDLLIHKIVQLWADKNLRNRFMKFMFNKSQWYYNSIADLDIGDLDLEPRFNPDKCIVIYQ